jgi:hypothetical protein
MIHEDILKRMTISRGEIGERNARIDNAREVASRITVAILGLGVVLLMWMAVRVVLS